MTQPAAKAAPPAAGTGQRRFRVSFYRRMKPRRVYELSVEATGSGQVSASLIQVRPVIPGALVAPAEADLDPSHPKARAVFHVTPLARGSVSTARVEIRRQSQVLQEIRFPYKVTTQGLTWVLALLTLLVPAGILFATKYRPLRGTVPRTFNPPEIPPEGLGPPPWKPQEGPPFRQNAPAKNPDPITQGMIENSLLLSAIGIIQDGEAKQKQGEPPAQDKKEGAKGGVPSPEKNPEQGEIPKKGDPNLGMQKKGPGRQGMPARKGGMPEQGPAVDIAPGKEPEDGKGHKSAAVSADRPASPGELLAREIRTNVPEVPEDFLKSNPWCPAVTNTVASTLGEGYDLACALATDHLSFWASVVLLAFTLISLVSHRTVRARRTGPGIAL